MVEKMEQWSGRPWENRGNQDAHVGATLIKNEAIEVGENVDKICCNDQCFGGPLKTEQVAAGVVDDKDVKVEPDGDERVKEGILKQTLNGDFEKTDDYLQEPSHIKTEKLDEELVVDDENWTDPLQVKWEQDADCFNLSSDHNLSKTIFVGQQYSAQLSSKICDVFGRCFPNENIPSQRELVHTNPYKCKTCSEHFNSLCKLSAYETVHVGRREFECAICGNRFAKKASLKAHISSHLTVLHYKGLERPEIDDNVTHNGAIKTFTCDICQKGFRSVAGLQYHVRTHTGEKPHKCNVCQRSFTAKHSLKNHLRSHTGEKPFKCDVCQKKIISTYNFKSHLLIHSGEKPYKCNVNVNVNKYKMFSC